jgi:small-conductance mechanosensitive channel
MTNELIDLFDEAKRIIDKQETLIKMQQSLINTMQQGLQGVELNELLLKKQLADLQEELKAITHDYIDVMGGGEKV